MKEHVCIQLKKEGPGAYPPGFILPSPPLPHVHICLFDGLGAKPSIFFYGEAGITLLLH